MSEARATMVSVEFWRECPIVAGWVCLVGPISLPESFGRGIAVVGWRAVQARHLGG